MESNFPGNSNTQKKAPGVNPKDQKAVPIVDGEIIRRKTSPGTKFMRTFFGSSAKEVGTHVWFDVAVPQTKDVVFNIFVEGLERAIYGDVRGRFRKATSAQPSIFGNASYQPYNQMSNPAVRPGYISDPRNEPGRQARSTHDFGQFIIPTKAEADAILSQMYELLEQYQMVTLYAFYEMCNIKPTHTDMNYGWMDLAGSRVHKTRGGYVLDIPKPIALPD